MHLNTVMIFHQKGVRDAYPDKVGVLYSRID